MYLSITNIGEIFYLFLHVYSNQTCIGNMIFDDIDLFLNMNELNILVHKSNKLVDY